MNNKIYRIALSEELIAPAGDLDGSYHSVNAMLAAITEPAIILIDGLIPEEDKSQKEAFDAVYQLRCSAVFYAAPIYFAKSMGNLDAFVDGIASTRAEILTDAAAILAELTNIAIDKNALSDDLRLLTFLFCRGDDYSVSPMIFAASPWIYEYPAALLIGDCAVTMAQTDLRFGPAAERSFLKAMLRGTAEWLTTLGAQGLLATKGLVDRIRLCPYCHTGKLNYIDSCPVCSSIDFDKKKMIHCFTCGHVAPEEDFLKGMMFICPRCAARLRHIGSDYDRPVETHVCHSCGERFIEPNVKADCLNCRQKSAAEDLIVRQLYHYGITDKGKKAVQLGSIDFEMSLFDSNRNVVPLYFYQVTDWLLQMKYRYSEEDFSLLCIKLGGIDEMEHSGGIVRLKSLIDELAARIRELVRLTDITTSTGLNTFWVLLPRTNQQGGEILASRIAQLTDMVFLENGVRINMQVKCFSISTEYAQRGSVAERLLGEYEATLLDAHDK